MSTISETLTSEEIQSITDADDFHVAPYRQDGTTYGTLTWIWSVEVDNRLFVRAYHGTRSRWYQAAITQKAGKIQAAGLEKKVAFHKIEGEINDQIDDGYRKKYNNSPYLSSMMSHQARLATIEVVPFVEKVD